MIRGRRWLLRCAVLLATATALSGCAGLGGQPSPRVNLAGIDSLPGEGLELRFLLKLRVQNPAETDLHYDGIWTEVDLRGQPLASGGAPVRGIVPRFGEAVVMLPVTASGLSIARQALGLLGSASDAGGVGPVAYVLRGRLGGVGVAGISFESRGEIDLRVP